MDKSTIRKMISGEKKQMQLRDIENFSDILCDAFLELDEYKSAQILFAYISFNQEVRTDRIIARALADGKKVAVPKVEGTDIKFRFIGAVSECADGTYGIPEPGDENEIADGTFEHALMLMPGLAFDPEGYRVGYGKGLYDRYLSRSGPDKFYRVALCYDFQMVEKIDFDEYDLAVDKIICAPSGRIFKIR